MRPSPTLSLALLATGIALVITMPARAQDNRKTLTVVPTAGPLKGKQVYKNSHALLIGINKYPGMPGKDLQYALNDVKDLAEVLVKSYGFPPKNVRILTDSDATLAGIRNALAELSDKRKVEPEDRVLIYFSGHGQTVKLPSGGDMGFLIPHDARVDLNDFSNAAPYLASCLPMEQLWNFVAPSAAKHVLIIADSCYSGLLTTARGREAIGEETLARLAATPVRQVMTAGQSGQISLEMSQIGHGAFTGKLLERLKALAAEDDVFTATELHSDVARSVGNLSRGKQIPQIGKYQSEGDFLFIPVAWTGPKQHAVDLIGVPSIEAAAPKPAAVSQGKSARTRKIGDLEIVQPEGWSYVSTYRAQAKLTPEIYKSGPVNGEFLSLEVWEHGKVEKAPFAAYFADHVYKELARQVILVEGITETGKTRAGLEMLRRTTAVQVNGKETLIMFAGLNQGKEMFMVKVDSSGPRAFSQWQSDIDWIIQSAKLPPAKVEQPDLGNLPKRRLADIEVTIPEGWELRVKAGGTAAIVNKELDAAQDPNERFNLTLTTETRYWADRHPTPEAHFRFQTDLLLKPEKIVDGTDSGYAKGKTSRGLDTLTRRVVYKFTGRETEHSDHIGIWKDNSSATISLRYSNSDLYKRLQKDVDFIINNLRFWQ